MFRISDRAIGTYHSACEARLLSRGMVARAMASAQKKVPEQRGMQESLRVSDPQWAMPVARMWQLQGLMLTETQDTTAPTCTMLFMKHVLPRLMSPRRP